MLTAEESRSTDQLEMPKPATDNGKVQLYIGMDREEPMTRGCPFKTSLCVRCVRALGCSSCCDIYYRLALTYSKKERVLVLR